MTRLLLIEDDERMGSLLKRYLESQDFQVVWKKDGLSGVQGIEGWQPDLVILDLMLPGFDGLEVCRRVRPDYRGPILMLTASDNDHNEIHALDLGIDDYLTKPFRTRVLSARIRALLRRVVAPTTTSSPDTPIPLTIGDLRILAEKREVYLGDTALPFTESEFELLWLLARHAGSVVSREDLYATLKGSAYQGFDRAIDMRISALRKKLNDSPPYRYIKTIRGKGYLMRVD